VIYRPSNMNYTPLHKAENPAGGRLKSNRDRAKEERNMSKIHTQFWTSGLFALMLAGLSAGEADADETILPCVQRDLQLLTFVEESGAASAVHGQTLADAVLAMVDARKSCLEGRVGDSLAQYDRITLHIVQARIPDGPDAVAPGTGLAGEGLRSAQN
jgi:hypothetical protein